MSASGSIAQQADELDDADMWVRKLGYRSDEFKQIAVCLKDIEFSLRCFQCNDFLRAPATVIPCRHTFCSECLRIKFTLDLNSTARKASCALCNVSVDTTGSDYGRCLQPNRSVDTLVQTFRLFREPLLEQLMKLEKCEGELPELLTAAQQGAAASEIMTKGGRSSPDAARRVLTSLHVISSVFSVTFPTLPPALPSPRPKLARTIYKGKNKRQLADLCNSAGLSISGDDAALQKRHKEYITLYNSECDSLRPRSNRELLDVIASRSQQRDQANRAGNRGGMDQTRYFSICLETLKQERKKLGESNATFFSSVPTGYADFDRDMEEGFTQLIKEHRKRRPMQRRPWVDTTDYESIATSSQLAALSSSARPALARPLSTPSSNPKKTRKSPFFAFSKPHVKTVAMPSGCSDAERIVAPTGSLPLPARNRSNNCRAEITRPDIGLEKVPVVYCTPMQEQCSQIQPEPTVSHKNNECRRRVRALEEPSLQAFLDPSNNHFSDSNTTDSSGATPIQAFMTSVSAVTQAIPRSNVPQSGLDMETLVRETSTHVQPSVKSMMQEIPVDINTSKRKPEFEANSCRDISRKSPKSTFNNTAISSDEPCLLGPWICRKCTFINNKNCSTLDRCEMCDSKRIVQVQATVYEID